jgi:hypothetical protein
MTLIQIKSEGERTPSRLIRMAHPSPESSVRILEEDNAVAVEPGPRSLCEVCGAPTRVQVLVRYSKEGPVHRTFCLDCGKSHIGCSYMPGVSRRPGAWLLFAAAGAVLMTVGVFGDWIIPSRHAGFGWEQGWGVILGVIVGLFGLLVRADLVALAGAFLVGASLSADWFGLTQGSGIGPKQQCLIGVGLVCVAIAMLLRMKISLRRSRPRDAGGQRSWLAAAGPAVAQ